MASEVKLVPHKVWQLVRINGRYLTVSTYKVPGYAHQILEETLCEIVKKWVVIDCWQIANGAELYRDFEVYTATYPESKPTFKQIK